MKKDHLSHSTEESDHLLIKRIPKRYKPLEVLGRGGCGVVMRCEDTQTKERVAIKVSISALSLSNEIRMLRKLSKKPFEDSFVKMLSAPWPGKYLVMEHLDSNFISYVHDTAPMELEEIRIVTEQLAVALKYLGANHIIHRDIKLNNIMFVDHIRQPLKVKLIDFGLAVFENEEIANNVLPAYRYWAPEIVLNLPISTALDVWSVGCVLSAMILGFCLFPGSTAYDQLYYMIKLLGPPPEHIVKASEEKQKYFKYENNVWSFKEPSEKKKRKLIDQKLYSLSSLDEIKIMRNRPAGNSKDVEERSECTELLKSMLTWDTDERITPGDILKHPFITKSSHRHTATHEKNPCCDPSTSLTTQPGTALQDQSAVNGESSEPSSETKTECSCFLMRPMCRCFHWCSQN